MEDTQVINNILRIQNVKAHTAIELKNELIAAGLIINVDFKWKYISDASTYSSEVEFAFKDPAHVTFYKLRWE